MLLNCELKHAAVAANVYQKEVVADDRYKSREATRTRTAAMKRPRHIQMRSVFFLVVRRWGKLSISVTQPCGNSLSELCRLFKLTSGLIYTDADNHLVVVASSCGLNYFRVSNTNIRV